MKTRPGRERKRPPHQNRAGAQGTVDKACLATIYAGIAWAGREVGRGAEKPELLPFLSTKLI